MEITPSDIERFWAKVDRQGPDACWPWKGNLAKNGYAQFGIKRQGRLTRMMAHRFAYTITYGPIPRELEACHECDQRYAAGDHRYRRCCNPAHIKPGTHRENMRDMRERGRRLPRRGEQAGNVTLTAAQVRQIRARYAAGGWSHRKLGAAYGVSGVTVSMILHGVTWDHLV